MNAKTENFNIKSEQVFESIRSFGKLSGRTIMRPILKAYYTMMSPKTPFNVKTKFLGALAYLFLPRDIIKDNRKLLGRVDDIIALLWAYNSLKKHITPEIINQVDETLDKWFSKEVVIAGEIAPEPKD
ncbi:DUF1232 domain-containing protein [Gammaproteobacteria bacterium]|nr:DUF1232 domain-containing protein [Gammaproteobacteria bacterium]